MKSKTLIISTILFSFIFYTFQEQIKLEQQQQKTLQAQKQTNIITSIIVITLFFLKLNCVFSVL